MSEEELVKINQKLKKMIDKSQVDESLARELLVRCDQLRVTLVLLQKIGLGKTVNELRRVATDEELLGMAKSLLKKWKKLLPDSVVGSSSVVDEKTIPSIDHCQRQTPQANSIQTSKVRKPKQSPSTSSASAVTWQTVETARVKSREMLASALSGTDLPEGSGDPVELSARIEDAVFKEMKDTNAKYGRRIRSRIFNLRDLKNPDLRRKVLVGMITPEQLAAMTAEEMTSDALKEECAKFKEIAHRESQLAVDEGIGSDLLQCERCKTKNCSYSELQTLSGDEPMTLFALCRNCGYRWRG